MRQHIDVVQRLFEADIIPFPTQRRAEAVRRDRQRYRLLVVSSTAGEPGSRPEPHLVDMLDGMNAGEVATQLSNYHPVERKGNMWISRPSSNTTYYMRVLVGREPPSEPELQQIEDQMVGV